LKNVLQFVMWNDSPSFLTCIFYIFPFHPWQTAIMPYFEISEMTTHTPCARDIWWTLDFASAFLSPGVNSRTELVPSPRAYARNGAPRRWLGNKKRFIEEVINDRTQVNRNVENEIRGSTCLPYIKGVSEKVKVF
jgi:hypothetical protein